MPMRQFWGHEDESQRESMYIYAFVELEFFRCIGAFVDTGSIILWDDSCTLLFEFNNFPFLQSIYFCPIIHSRLWVN